MAYYQIDRSQTYIQSLGLLEPNPTPNGIDDRVQRATADAFKRDNSFYSPATQRSCTASGGVDDAEDGDVIMHEYGHSIQDASVARLRPQLGLQPGALGEGFGDYCGGRDVARSVAAHLQRGRRLHLRLGRTRTGFSGGPR